jgi:hypothetical protein
MQAEEGKGRKDAGGGGEEWGAVTSQGARAPTAYLGTRTEGAPPGADSFHAPPSFVTLRVHTCTGVTLTRKSSNPLDNAPHR